MTTYIALLRAVNLPRYGKISMADLRSLLGELGFRNVETYIQSGNAVFDAPGSAAKVGAAIVKSLESHMGASVPVLMRTHEEMGRVIAENPFAAESAADGARVHVVFLGTPAQPGAQANLDRIVTQYPHRRDRYHLAGDTIYLHLPDGAADTKFQAKAVERATGVRSGHCAQLEHRRKAARHVSPGEMTEYQRFRQRIRDNVLVWPAPRS